MRRSPLCPTNIAKLVAASAGHVVTSLVFLNDEFAVFALPIVQVALEKHDLVRITLSYMDCEQTFGTAGVLAGVADHYVLSCCLEKAFAALSGTHLDVRVFHGKVELA